MGRGLRIGYPAGGGNGAPSWFNAMVDKTWYVPTTNTIRDVLTTSNVGEPEGICTGFSGGALDQIFAEIWLAGNGGHASYGGNEKYACVIRAEQPAFRLVGGVQASTAGGENTTTNGPGTFADGSALPCHTYNYPAAYNGTYWQMGLPAMGSSEHWTTAIFSADRDSGIWVPRGKIHTGSYVLTGNSFWQWQGACSSVDNTTGKVWCVAHSAITTPANGVACIDVNDPENPIVTLYDIEVDVGQGWGVIAWDLRLWIIGRQNGTLYVMDLTNPQAGFTVVTPTGTGRFYTAGAVYHAPSRAILAWDDDGADILKLSIGPDPFDEDGWEWSTVSPALSNSVIPSAGQQAGTFGRFGIVDMGNGHDALTLINDIDEGVYVYRLPAGPLS